jgi:hypothetical protein
MTSYFVTFVAGCFFPTVAKFFWKTVGVPLVHRLIDKFDAKRQELTDKIEGK